MSSSIHRAITLGTGTEVWGTALYTLWRHLQAREKFAHKIADRSFLMGLFLVPLAMDRFVHVPREASALRSHRRGNGLLGENLSNSSDLRTHAAQLLLDMLVATVNVVDAVHNGLAVGNQRSQHQRSRRPQVGSQHRRRAQGSLPFHDGAVAFDLDIGSHAHQFLRVHEAVLEDILRDYRSAVGLS